MSGGAAGPNFQPIPLLRPTRRSDIGNARHPRLSAVPYVVVGRAIQDQTFRYALLGAESADAIRSVVWNELELLLTDGAVQQIMDLDTAQVDQALGGLQGAGPSPQ